MTESTGLVAVVFDFDGVIVDSMGLQEQAWREAAAENAVSPELVTSLVRNLHSGNAGGRMFNGLELGPELQRALRTSKDRLWARDRHSAHLFPGAEEGLRHLAERLRIGIATTAPREYVDGILDRAGVVECITAIRTDRDSARPKPNPSMLRELIAGPLRADVSTSVMVGDSDTDRRMARAAGVAFVRYDTRARRRTAGTLVATNWVDLVEMLDSRTTSTA